MYNTHTHIQQKVLYVIDFPLGCLWTLLQPGASQGEHPQSFLENCTTTAIDLQWCAAFPCVCWYRRCRWKAQQREGVLSDMVSIKIWLRFCRQQGVAIQWNFLRGGPGLGVVVSIRGPKAKALKSSQHTLGKSGSNVADNSSSFLRNGVDWTDDPWFESWWASGKPVKSKEVVKQVGSTKVGCKR